jgi:hypothetical protein
LQSHEGNGRSPADASFVPPARSSWVLSTTIHASFGIKLKIHGRIIGQSTYPVEMEIFDKPGIFKVADWTASCSVRGCIIFAPTWSRSKPARLISEPSVGASVAGN